MNQIQNSVWRSRGVTLALVAVLGAGGSAFAQSVTQPSAAGSNTVAPEDEEVVQLSPFEVDASNDVGYYSERTLAGSRIDTKLSDLGASISLINREQMEDTAATDINDIFLYDVNTEGSNTYTESFVGARGGLRDFNAGQSHTDGTYRNDQTNNRVRGLASADTSRNYYPSISQVGFDSYNTSTVEINRGPNSLLFGQGSAGGIVNQNTANAYTNAKRTEIQVRLSDNGGFRSYFNHNQPLVEDVLGVYVAALYDGQGFERKPSYDITRRVYGALTYNPTRNVRIRGNFENFDSNASRPNTLTPRDNVTPWINAGRPAYDPVTRTVTIQDTGQVLGPYVQSNLSPGYDASYLTGDNALHTMLLADGSPNAGYIPGIRFIDTTRPVTLIDSRDNYFTTERRPVGDLGNINFSDPMPSAADRTAAQHMIADRNYARSYFADGPEGIASWNPPGVSDKSVYDWTEYNVNSMNRGETDAQTMNLEIDLKINDNWYVQAGWFKQQMDSKDHYTVSQLEVATLWVDPNVNLPNGDPNPFFGQPYVHDTQGDSFLRTIDNENFRVQTALKFDFSGRNDILRHLGTQNFIGIATRQNYDTSQIRTRAVEVGGHPLLLPNVDLSTTGNYTYWNSNNRRGRVQRQYYMGSPGAQGQVTRSAPEFGAPSFGGPTENTFNYYNWTSGAWTVLPGQFGNAISEATTYRTRRTTDSYILAWNASMLGDRFVPTIGFRHDEVSNQSTQGTAGLAGRADPVEQLNAADFTDHGYPILDLLFNNWGDEQTVPGDTWTYGATFDVWRTDQHELTVFYNQSENFNPPTSTSVDFFGNELPRPTGNGKDYGFGFGLFDNKLVARVTWFENSSDNATTSVANFSRDRLRRVDTDLMRGWAEVVARIEAGQLDAFVDAERNPFEEIPRTVAMESRMAELMGIPIDYYDTLGAPVGATASNSAEGVEISLTYNPLRNWTFRGAVSSQETSFSVVAPEVDAWYAERISTWESAASGLNAAQNQWLYNGLRQVNLTNFWSGYGYTGDTDIDNPSASHSSQEWFQNVVQSQIDLYKTQEGVAVPTQRKWRANLITKYTFTTGPLKNSFIGGGVRYEDKAAIGYYGKAGDSTNPTLINAPDASRPIFDKANTYFDLWCGYRTKVHDDKVGLLVQLNVRNIFEGGDLRPIAVNYDGTPHTFRIIDPREIQLTTTLQF